MKNHWGRDDDTISTQKSLPQFSVRSENPRVGIANTARMRQSRSRTPTKGSDVPRLKYPNQIHHGS